MNVHGPQMECDINLIKTDKVGIIALYALLARRAQNISKNQDIHPHQSRITYSSLL